MKNMLAIIIGTPILFALSYYAYWGEFPIGEFYMRVLAGWFPASIAFFLLTNGESG